MEFCQATTSNSKTEIYDDDLKEGNCEESLDFYPQRQCFLVASSGRSERPLSTCNLDHDRPNLRWTARECHRFFEHRPWEDVRRFYSLVATQQLSLSDLIFKGPLKRSVSEEASRSFLNSCLVKSPLEESRRGKWERKTFKIVISYDGSAFEGWQKQPGLFTVQGLVEQALGRFVNGKRATFFESQGLSVEASVSVAGRTDKGVHAVGQVCSFYTWLEKIKLEDIEVAINCLAPEALRVVSVEEVSRTFHAAFSACWRRYVYILPLHGHEVQKFCNRERIVVPACEHHCSEMSGAHKNGWELKIEQPWEHFKIDVLTVNQLLFQLEGHSLSYASFSRDMPASKSRGIPTECMIYHARAAIAELPAMTQVCQSDATKVLCIEVVANRFLRKMVRVLVATTLREAAMRGPLHCLIQLTNTACRHATAPPAPACGLCLAEVGYKGLNNINFLIT